LVSSHYNYGDDYDFYNEHIVQHTNKAWMMWQQVGKVKRAIRIENKNW
jgi:hypothetical protein